MVWYAMVCSGLLNYGDILMSEQVGKTWLELSAAAEYLGVHSSTLRRWADDSKVPCFRTPGGHRRFRVIDLDTFLASQRQGGRSSAIVRKLAEPIASSLIGQSGVRQESWYGRLDHVQRGALRADGERMMAVLIQYTTRSNGGEAFLDEAKRLIVDYAQMCHAVGLSTVETIRGFTLMRQSITDSLYHAGTLAGPPDAETWRLYRRTNQFFDTMLLTMIERCCDSWSDHRLDAS
jgi:excisionase family DNA binding protein